MGSIEFFGPCSVLRARLSLVLCAFKLPHFNVSSPKVVVWPAVFSAVTLVPRAEPGLGQCFQASGESFWVVRFVPTDKPRRRADCSMVHTR